MASRSTPTMDTSTPTETVGSLLAAIATALQDALRILMFADKRGWGPDEFEQVRAVEEALDEAKRDFQAMAPLVNGQFYYENDRRRMSLLPLPQTHLVSLPVLLTIQLNLLPSCPRCEPTSRTTHSSSATGYDRVGPSTRSGCAKPSTCAASCTVHSVVPPVESSMPSTRPVTAVAAGRAV